MISGSCDTPCEEADICDVYPRFGRSDSFLEVFGQSATPSQGTAKLFDLVVSGIDEA